MKHPLVGDPVSFRGFFSGPASGHLLGLFADASGASEQFSILSPQLYGGRYFLRDRQSAPMVAALWGVLAWKEFANSGPAPKPTLTHVCFLRDGYFSGGPLQWLIRLLSANPADEHIQESVGVGCHAD